MVTTTSFVAAAARPSALSSEPGLRAVIFDVDGTLVDSERDGHRVAFNRSFEEFGLPYRWSVEEYGELLHVTGGQRRINAYLEAKGIDRAERERLVPELHARKTEIIATMVDEGRVQVRAGAPRLLDELTRAGVRLAVATTGSRGWVDRLLRRLLPDTEFDVVVTGDEVAHRKPDPEAFLVALDRLETGPAHAVAVEDSGEGLRAAQGAGLRCAVVVNDYTAGHDLAGAELVLTGFGAPSSPAEVVAGAAATGCEGILDVATLESLVTLELGD
ncbi:MAG: HAD-IA family hydrolase [Actinomycetota bacterium]|nr:HAD-IA family hydrolase [Actinomycetota bacterium]